MYARPAPVPPPRASREKGGYDPISYNYVEPEKVYSRDGDLVFESLQTHTAYYKMLDQGFVVVRENERPKLVMGKVTKELVWELQTNQGNLARLTSRTVLPPETTIVHLGEGRYEFVAVAPELQDSFLANTKRREIAIGIIVVDKNGKEFLNITSSLSAHEPKMTVPFQVIASIAPATARMSFRSPSTFNSLVVKASITKAVPHRKLEEEAQKARESSHLIMRDNEFLVELEKDANGIGMTFKWDPERRGVAVKDISPVGVAYRSKIIKIGDIVRAVQGVRVDHLDFKGTQTLLRNVPVRVILVMEHAPPGWRGFQSDRPPAVAPVPLTRQGSSQRGIRDRPRPPRAHTDSAARPPPLPPRNDLPSSVPPEPLPRPLPAREPPPRPPHAAPTVQAIPSRHHAEPPLPPAAVTRPPRPSTLNRPPPPSPRAAPRPPPQAPVPYPPAVSQPHIQAPQPLVRQPPPAPVRRPSSEAPPAPVRRPSPAAPPSPMRRPSPAAPPSPMRRPSPPPAVVARPPPPAAQTATTQPVAPPVVVQDTPTVVESPSASPVAPSPPPSASEFGPEYAKYVKMKRAGLPDGAIVNAMNRDNVPIPIGFFPEDFEAPKQVQIQIPHRDGASSASSPRPPPAAGGASMVDALKSFDPSKLKHREPPSEEKPRPASTTNPLLAELQQKAKGGLRKRTQEEIEADLENRKSSEIASAGKNMFNAALLDKFKNAIPRDESDDDAEVSDDEWEM